MIMFILCRAELCCACSVSDWTTRFKFLSFGRNFIIIYVCFNLTRKSFENIHEANRFFFLALSNKLTNKQMAFSFWIKFIERCSIHRSEHNFVDAVFLFLLTFRTLSHAICSGCTDFVLTFSVNLLLKIKFYFHPFH